MMDNKNFNEENALRNAQPLSDAEMEQAAGGAIDWLFFKDALPKYTGQCRYCGKAFETTCPDELEKLIQQHEQTCPKRLY